MTPAADLSAALLACCIPEPDKAVCMEAVTQSLPYAHSMLLIAVVLLCISTSLRLGATVYPVCPFLPPLFSPLLGGTWRSSLPLPLSL